MNSISKAILLSAMGLCVNSGNVTYASIKIPDSIPKSGISTLHTHHTQIRHTLKYPNLSSRFFDKKIENGVKVASVCFITDTGACSGDKFGNLETPGGGGGKPDDHGTPQELCQDAGFTNTPCPTGSTIESHCQAIVHMTVLIIPLNVFLYITNFST